MAASLQPPKGFIGTDVHEPASFDWGIRSVRLKLLDFELLAAAKASRPR